VSSTSQGTIQVESNAVRVPPAGATVRFKAAQYALGPIRITASTGYELQCAMGGPWQKSCNDSALAMGAERSLPVRPTPGGTPPTSGSVDIFSGGATQSVTLAPPIAATHGGLAGSYSGTATLVSATMTAPVPGAPPAVQGVAASPVTVPVTAQVFASSGATGVLALTDPLQALAPAGTWLGSMAIASATSGTVSFPKVLMEGGAVTAAVKSEIIGSVTAAPFTLAASGQTLTVQMDVVYQGLQLSGQAPDARWQLVLQKTGALAAGASAPVVPPDVTSLLPANAATTPSDWFQSAQALFETFSSGSPPAEQAQILSTWQATSGDPTATPRRLDACSPGGRLVAGVAATADEWQSVTFSPVSPIPPNQIASTTGTGKDALLGEVLSQAAATFVVGASVSAVTATPTAGPDGSVPCAVTFNPGLVYCYDGTANSTSLQLPAIDRCDAIAEEMKCNVETKSWGTFGFQLQLNTESTIAANSPCGTLATQPTNAVTGVVTKVCTLPPVAWNCGELASCAGPDGRTAYSPTTPLQVSGDLLCGNGAPSTAPTPDGGAPPSATANESLATVADWNRNQPSNTDTVANVVENVLSDLSTLTQNSTAPFPVARGFDAARQLVALEYATEVDRERATTNPTLPPSPGATRFAARLLQQWATMEALVAHETSQRAQVPASVEGAAPDPLYPATRDALTDSLNGWLLFLHPRFAGAISKMDGGVLATPDYRADWASSVPADPNDSETDGLPIAILDALSAQFTLVDVIVQQGALAGDVTALPFAGRALRDAVLVQAVARDVYAHILAASTTPPSWNAKYLAADKSFAGLLRRAVGDAQGLALGKNPIGIEDSDLPLYFQGENVDPVGEFSAISDYLLGNGSTVNAMAWAPLAVSQAQMAATAVGAAYQTQVTRQYEAALATTDAEDRLDQIRTDAGNALSNLCGLPANLTPLTAVEGWTNFNASTCFLTTNKPECQVSAAAADAELDQPSVLYQLCVAQNLAQASSTVTYTAGGLAQVLEALLQNSATACTFSPAICPTGTAITSGCLQCGSVLTGNISVADLASLDLSHVTGDMMSSAQWTCAALYPTARQSLPNPAQDVLGNADCLNGSLGDLALSLQSAQQDVQIAQSKYSDHLDAYDIEVNNCYIKIASNDLLQSLESMHDASMQSLRAQKAASDNDASIANAVYNCASIVTSAATSGSPVGAAIGAASAAVGCGAAFLQADFQIQSTNTQEAMDNAEDEYQSEVDMISEDTDVKLCLNEAHQELVGMRTAAQQIDAAYTDWDHAQYDLEQGVGNAQQTYDQAVAAIATAEARTIRPPALDTWEDQRISDFVKSMSEARLVTYLAERAVEYEYQASLMDRATILAADTPDQLADAMTDLRSTSGTLGINGNRPSNLKVVLSMRDQLLQLFDATHVLPAEQKLSPSDRFKLLLRDPRFSVYTNGTYAGQAVPFTLAPLGALHGDSEGIEIFATTDCAERVWSVNASILGTGTLSRGSATTFARVDLLKKNTFFSQWCGAAPSGQPFQVASVRPSHNLFLDPEYGSAVQASVSSAAPTDMVPDEVSLDSRARIQAYFNVPQATFEEDSYANGETSELAARGLYGDYALFFSADELSLPQTDSQGHITGYSDGLDLTAIDDILLRLDYVSVAR
jgi:hypothetical protein